jgi:hypothetical protein
MADKDRDLICSKKKKDRDLTNLKHNNTMAEERNIDVELGNTGTKFKIQTFAS